MCARFGSSALTLCSRVFRALRALCKGLHGGSRGWRGCGRALALQNAAEAACCTVFPRVNGCAGALGAIFPRQNRVPRRVGDGFPAGKEVHRRFGRDFPAGNGLRSRLDHDVSNAKPLRSRLAHGFPAEEGSCSRRTRSFPAPEPPATDHRPDETRDKRTRVKAGEPNLAHTESRSPRS